MMKNPIILACLCGILWGTWPILANASKASSLYITLAVTLSSLLVVAIFFITKGLLFSEVSLVINSGSNNKIFLPLVAGVLNATAMIFYGSLVSSNSGFEVTKYVPIAATLLPIFALIAGFIFLNEPINSSKIIGVIIACIGIYFINK